MPKEKEKRGFNPFHPVVWILLAVVNILLLVGGEYFVAYPIRATSAVYQNRGSWVGTVNGAYAELQALDLFDDCEILDANENGGETWSDAVYVLYENPEGTVKLLRMGKSLITKNLSAHEENAVTVTGAGEYTFKHFLQTDTVYLSVVSLSTVESIRIASIGGRGPMWSDLVVIVYVVIVIAMFAVEALIIWAINRSRKKKIQT